MKVRIVAFDARNKREALRIAGDRALPHINRRRWGYGVFAGETDTVPFAFRPETMAWVDTPGFREAWFPTLAEAQAWAEGVTTVTA